MNRRGPYNEITDPKNKKINATLTELAWSEFAVLQVNGAFFNDAVEADPSKAPDPADLLIDIARETSGSIDGEHRKDLVEALKGAKVNAIGLVGTTQEAQSQKAANGSGESDGGL